MKSFLRFVFLFILVIGGLATGTNAQAPTNGLIAYYPFNGNANDASGNGNNGTVNGATLTTDRNGQGFKAYAFDGSQSIDLGTATQLTYNGAFSVSFWIKTPASTTISRAAISALRPNANFYVSVLNTGKLYFGYGTGSSLTGFAGNQVVADDAWHHVLVTYDLSTVDIYIDGALDKSRPNTTIYKQFGRTYVGNHPISAFGLSPMTGSLDEFRAYNRALSAAEVQQIYQAEASEISLPRVNLNTGLVAYYNLNINVNDASGNGNHGLAQNNLFFGPDRFGNEWRAASFDGVDDYIDISKPIGPFSEITASVWVNIAAQSGDHQALISSPFQKLIHFQLFESGNNIIYANNSTVLLPNISQLPLNQWKHIVLTSKSGLSKIYVNGIEYGSSSTTFGEITETSSLRIGSGFQNGRFLNGRLDDIRIYNRALSNAEVVALYNTESSGLQLSNALRFDSGINTLNVGSGYNLKGTLKNSGSAAWTGDVYIKVKNGTPTLMATNQTIGVGAFLNLSFNFFPQTDQIGSNVPVELLTKQSSGTFVSVAAIIGSTVNPVLVNIEEASNVPVVRVPFIRLNTSQVNPGGTVEISGGNFEPGTQVVLQSSPNIPDANYPSQIAGSDGSINVSFTVPATFKDKYLTFIAQDTKYNNPTAYIVIKQANEVATLSIVSPNKENATIEITPGGEVAIQIADKLLKGAAYAQSGASRKYRYEVGYRFTGGSDPNAFTLLFQMPENSGLLNSELRETIRVPMPTAHFGTGTQGNGWPLQFIVRDMYDNQRIGESPKVYVKVVPSIGKISLKWDRSFTPMPTADPIGIAADGVARMYLVVEKTNSSVGSPIQSVNLTLLNSESGNDPANFNNGAWLGRVKYATQQNNNQYSEEANDLSTISAQTSTPNADGKYWFWYLAPDDFMRDGLPAGLDYSNESERYVHAKFMITYADGSVEQLLQSIQIVRPPLMLVHGLGGTGSMTSESTWGNFKLLTGADRNLFKYYWAPQMYGDRFFDQNARVLLGKDPTKGLSSFQYVTGAMRRSGFASNQVDYICHSMGGSMLRHITSFMEDDYKVGLTKPNAPQKNYNKGWVNKFISINTPHNGSPGADLIAGVTPLLNTITTELLDALFKKYSSIQTFFSLKSYSSSKDKNLYEASDAVKNLTTNRATDGIAFKSQSLPSHLIASDYYSGSSFTFEAALGLASSKLKGVTPVIDGFLLMGKALTIPDGLNTSNTLFSDFIRKNRASLALDWIGKNNVAATFDALNSTFVKWGNYNGKYPEQMWDSDLVVPIMSQTASLPITASNVSLIPNDYIFDFNQFHIGIQNSPKVSEKIKHLLNRGVSSSYFGSIPANNNPQTTLTTSGLKIPQSSGLIATSNLENDYTYVDARDTTKLKIIYPVINQQFDFEELVTVESQLYDTVGLKKVELFFNGDWYIDTTKSTISKFVIEGAKASGPQTISVVAYYVRNDSILMINDTTQIIFSTNQAITLFEVNPDVKQCSIEEKFNPEYNIYFNTFIVNTINPTKLNVSISNPSCLTYNAQTGQFKGTQKGEAVVIFTYDGTFKDTMYVAVGGGGVPYPQQIQTSDVSATGDGTVCAGATISVPFTTSGGAFDEGNQFIVQLSDASGENFTSLETTGTSSPLTARIPNGLANADTYKVRVVSLSPPVLGIAAGQSLKIRSCETQGNFTISGNSVVCEGESVTLTASGCDGTLSWSNGGTGASITVTPYTTSSYMAYCVGSSGDSSYAHLGIAVLPKTRLNIVATTVAACFPVLNAYNLSYGLRPVWRKDGAVIKGMQSTTYNPLEPGTYTVEPEGMAGSWVPQWGNLTVAHLADVTFPSASVGFAVGEEGVILKSTDDGATWQSLQSGTTSDLKRIQMISPSIGWAVGRHSTLIKTEDGGNTWRKQQIPGDYQMTDISFADENSGWAIGNSMIYHTSNGGSTWTPQYSGTSYNLSGIHAISFNTAWIVAPNGIVLKTTNGGNAWVQVNVGSSESLADVYFTDSNHGWIVGTAKTILHTSNGGATWTAQTAGIGTYISVFNQVQFVDNSVGWIRAGYDYFKTTDGGSTWTQLPLSSGGYIGFSPRFFMKNSTEGIMVGEWGRIQRTSDAASTWPNITRLPKTQLEDVHFVDNNTGFVVGKEGVFLNTTDGGKNWNSRKITVEGYSSGDKVFFASAKHGWVSDRHDYILRTTDGGATWNKHTIVSNYFQVNSIYFVNTTTGWVVGSQGNIFKTTDGGVSWSPQSGGITQDLQEVFFLNANQGWAVGNGGTILFTSNGGTTWTSKATPTTSSFIAVHFTSDLEGWASTWDGDGLYHTTDGGSTWTKVILDTADGLYANFTDRIQFISPAVGFAHTQKFVYMTTDGGANWKKSYHLNNYFGMYFTDATHGWVVGGDIKAFKPIPPVCASDPIVVNAKSTRATLSGSQAINAGQTATLSVSFTGDAPYTLVFNGQTYTNVTNNPFTIPVASTATTTYTLTSVSNACGAGTVSGSAVVTVHTNGGSEVFSIKTGSWHDPSTWDCNCVPNNTHTVEVKQNHTVTVSTADANLKDLKFSNGNLNFQNQKKLCFGCN